MSAADAVQGVKARLACVTEYRPGMTDRQKQALLALATDHTGSSDTMVFIQATPEVADRWRDVKLGESHDGEPLAVRSPMWDLLWANIGYAADLDLENPPEDLSSPPLRELV
jgi:hypothetical protein